MKFFLGDTVSIDDESSSDDQQSNSGRFNRQASPITAIPNNRYSNVNSFQENTNSITDHDRDESIDSFKTDERSSKELSIDEYLPKTQLIQSPIPSITSPTANIRLSSSIVVN